MLLGCDKFLDRAGGGGARPGSLAPPERVSPWFAEQSRKETPPHQCIGSNITALAKWGTHPAISNPAVPSLSQTWLEQTSPHPTGGKGLL